jgi:hypothetical protein
MVWTTRGRFKSPCRDRLRTQLFIIMMREVAKTICCFRAKVELGLVGVSDALLRDGKCCVIAGAPEGCMVEYEGFSLRI